MHPRLRALLLLVLLTPPAAAEPAPDALPLADDVVLYIEDFEGRSPLHERGWTTHTSVGATPGYVLAANGTALGVPAARGGATTATEERAYPQRLDVRLVSPAYDLRHVAGAPLPTPAAPALRPFGEAQDAIMNATIDIRRNFSRDEDALVEIDTKPALDAGRDALLWPPGGSATADRLDLGPSPLGLSRLDAPRAALSAPGRPSGVGAADLTIRHAWAFAPGDGATLEIRSRTSAGAWSEWTPVAPMSGATSFLRAPGVLPTSELASYNGHLPDGTAAFLGESGGLVTSIVPLDAYAGRLVQVAFRARADSPLPPDAFGHFIDRVELRAALADADLAIEGFSPIEPGALAAVGAWITPTVHVRNWGAAPSLNVSVRVSVTLDGAAVGPVHVERLDLGPGERHTVTLAALRSERPANLTISAQIVHGIPRADAWPQNDQGSVSVRIASEPRLRIDLVVPRDAAVTGRRDEKPLLVHAWNDGTAAIAGTLSIVAQDDTGRKETVASRAVDLAPLGAMVSSSPEREPARYELVWRPSARGSYAVHAELAGTTSDRSIVHVDLSPPPLLRETFSPRAGGNLSFGELGADAMPNWSFAAWTIGHGEVAKLHPAAPSPRRMLAARATDDLGEAEAGAAHDATATAARALGLRLVLPARANLTEPTDLTRHEEVNLSYARLLLVASEAGCPCGDARERAPLLAPVLNATVHQENLTIAKNETRIRVNDTTIQLGGANGALLYVIANATLEPGVSLTHAPLAIAREGGDELVLLPASESAPYEDAGLRCCVFGPYSSRDLAAFLPPLPLVARNTSVVANHTIARSLSGLLAALPPGGEAAVALQHRAAFGWTNGSGLRGLIEIEPGDALPPEARLGSAQRILRETETRGWETLVIPLTPYQIASSPRLRLTLQSAGDEPLGACPWLDQNATCPKEAAWHVDDIRILHRAAGGAWRVVARDDLEREHEENRWTGATGAGLPTVHARGWSLDETTKEPPHRFHLLREGVTRDGEENVTGALAWGSRADTGPVWSVASLPPVDTSRLAAPALSFLTRYDLGAAENGTHPTGVAVVARIERADGSSERRLLLPGEGGAAYEAHVSAPAFDPLARDLRIEVPRGASATALVGVEPEWTRATFALPRVAPGEKLVVELHALTARARPAWWHVDDVRIGEPGPAHDLAVVDIPTLQAPAAVGLGVPTPLAFTIADEGLFPPSSVRLEAWITDPAGNITYGPRSTEAGEIADGRVTLALPEPWTPSAYGSHTVRARVIGDPADERAENDVVMRVVDVRDEIGGTILSETRGLVGTSHARPGAPLALEARLRNNGTLPWDAANPAKLALQVYDGGQSLLAAPIRFDVSALAARTVPPGATIDVKAPAAWTPTRSGVFRAEIALELPALRPEAVAVVDRTLRVEQSLPSVSIERFVPTGRGWTNATAGPEGAAWTFVAEAGNAGELTTPSPLDLRSAAHATLALEHRQRLEEGFDGGVVEARVPGGDWLRLEPREQHQADVLAPSSLVPPAALAAPAFTGNAATRTTTFDLADRPELRERVTLLDTRRDPIEDLAQEWLGPPPGSLHAPSRPAPASGPADAIAYERTDELRYPLAIPGSESGAIVVRLRDWRGLGDHGEPDAPPSRVRVWLEAANGHRYSASPAENDDDRHATSTLRTVRFPDAPLELGGSAAIVIEHVEVAARVPPQLRTIRDRQTTFASDMVSPHHGHAVEELEVALETTRARLPLDLGEPSTRASARWLTDAGPKPAEPTAGGYEPTVADPLWRREDDGWIARPATSVPAARLVLPIDLRLAVKNATLEIEGTRRLTTLVDHATGGAGGLSLVGVEVSTDRGRTWRPAPSPQAQAVFHDETNARGRQSAFGDDADPEGNSPTGTRGRAVSGDSNETLAFDLSAFVGSDVLVALHAAFSTTQAAREDEWRVRSLRVDADILRGDAVELRLRAASDDDGARGAWEIVDLSASVVRHGRGLGVRIIEPDDDPITEGFRTLAVEVLNRGPDTTPAATVSVLVTDPAERGGRAHGANRSVPSLAPGTSAILTIRGADLNWFLAANATPSLVEARLAPVAGDAFRQDDVATRAVGGANVRERSVIAPRALNVTPQAIVPAANATPTIRFTAWISNDGEDAATLGPSALRIWKGDVNVRNLTNAVPNGGRLDAGATREVVWTWRPDATQPRGSYTAQAEIITSTQRGPVHRTLNVTFILADSVDEARGRVDRFGGEPTWTCVSQAPCARDETTIHRSAPASLAVGVPSGSLASGNARAVIESPEFPVNATLGAILRVHTRHALAPGENAVVSLARIAHDGTRGPPEEIVVLRARSAGYDELRFVELQHAIAPSPELRGVVVRLEAPTPGNASASRLVIDDVSVTPLDISWRSPSRVVVADGVTKTFRVALANEGTLADEHVLTFRDENGRPLALPAGWTIEARESATGRLLASSAANATGRLAVPPGGERRVDITLTTTPTGAGAPLRGSVPVVLTANSTLLPDLSRTLRVDVRAQGAARSDVGLLGVEARAPHEPAGRARTIEVASTNRGLAPAAAPLRAIVHPPEGVDDPPETLADASGATSPTLSLAPGARRTTTFLWTPRHSGEHRIVVAIDPENALAEADRADHIVERRVVVPALPYPDLRVGVHVESEQAFLGRATRMSVNVTNHGAATARDVAVSLRAGVVDLMADGSPIAVGDLVPGATRVLQATWTPVIPGNTTLLATAFARAGRSELVETLHDNARDRPVFVREPTGLLEPAGAPGTLRLVNAGNANETYLLRASVADAWSYAIRVDGQRATRVELAPNASALVALEPFPPPDARAGGYDLVVEATAASSGETRRALVAHTVASRHALRVYLLPATLSLDEPYLEMVVENGGNANETIRLSAMSIPEGWRLLGTRVEVDAGARATARLLLDVGRDARPGSVPVALAWTSGHQSGTIETRASVPTVRSLSIGIDGRIGVGREGNVTIRLQNDGNIDEHGVLDLELPPGAVADNARRAVSVPRGSVVEVPAWISTPEANGTSARVAAAFTSDIEARASARLPLAQHDLRLGWRPTSGATPDERSRETVTLLNAGAAHAHATVITLLLDGKPVAARELGTLAPGEEADATLTWMPTPGLHTIAVLAQTLDGAPDATPDDNARAATLDISQPASPLVAAARRAESPAAPVILLLAALSLVALVRRPRA